ncbi:MAG: DUF6503 family protein [Calditrichia bacterium]
MFKRLLTLLGLTLLMSLTIAQDGKQLVEKMTEAVGGKQTFYDLGDVEYTYTYHDLVADKKDVGVERYLFDGELSWVDFSVREKFAHPEIEGKIMQGYDGENYWTTINSVPSKDEKILGFSRFLRKTNYYWFSMFFKLLDDGINYEKLDDQAVNGTSYHRVKITFGDNVGDASDIYVLYIHPETYLVDQFLFTVQAFKITDPLLMEVKYSEIDGVKLPTWRRYAPANWEGQIVKEEWAEEISENIKFGNGFTKADFQVGN